MADKAALFALAEKLAAAQGPCRELDHRIAFTLLPNSKGCAFPKEDWWVSEAVRNQWNSPRYTFSVDAAMSLRPEGHHLRLETDDDVFSVAHVGDGSREEVRGIARGPALAVAIACLKARATHPHHHAKEQAPCSA